MITVTGIGIAACTWGLEPGYPWVPEYDPLAVLAAAARIGFDGVEPATLNGPGHLVRAELDALSLRCPARFVGLALSETDEALTRGTEAVADLVALAGDVLLVGIEDSGDTRVLQELVARGREAGVSVAIHPEVGGPASRADEVERLLDTTEGLTVCLDTGHFWSAGDSDVPVLVRRFDERIAHVHLKDADADVSRAYQGGVVSAREAVQRGLWRPLGQGSVPLVETLDALANIAYRGWLVLEQDFAPDPDTDAESALTWVRRSLPRETPS